MKHLPTAAQGIGLLAALVGLFLILPLGAAVLASGVLVLIAGVAAEVIVQRACSAPSDRRSGPNERAVA